MIRYTGGIVDWTIAGLEDLDHKTRKLMTAYRILHIHRVTLIDYTFREELGQANSCRSHRQ